jgi:hypothetical protein
MSRRLRTKPAARSTVVLTDRDIDVMLMVAHCKYASTEQVSREAFPSEDRCRRRLRQLLDCRYISATLVSSKAPNLISIARDGLVALRDHGIDTTGLQPPNPVRLSAVSHALLGTDARMYTAGLIVKDLGRLVAVEPGKGSAADKLGLTDARIAPDFIYFIELRGVQGVAAVELDSGHEGLALREKLDKYRRWLPQQRNTQLWLIADGDESRLREVARMTTGIEQWTRLLRPQDLRLRPVQHTPKEFNMLIKLGFGVNTQNRGV